MKLKFCGLNNLDSLRQACDLNADFVGFIFAEQSPRKVELNFIAQLIDFNFCQTVPVCVFVNPLIQEVKKAINIYQMLFCSFMVMSLMNSADSFISHFGKVSQ